MPRILLARRRAGEGHLRLVTKLFVLAVALCFAVNAHAACTFTSAAGTGQLVCTLDAYTDDQLVTTTAVTDGTVDYNYMTSTERKAALRWKASVPKSATVANAYITWTAANNYTSASNGVIYLLNEANCAAFSVANNPYSAATAGSPVTSNHTASWTLNSTYNSANIASLVTAWIGLAGYDYGQYIGLRTEATGTTAARTTWQAYSSTTSVPTTKWPTLTIQWTGGDPVLDAVYMADPHVRSKQYIYPQLYNITSGQKLKVTLDGSAITGSPITITNGITASGEEKILVDYTGLSAGEHTLRIVITNESDEEYATTVWTRTWTTLHNGTGYVSINEDNAIVVGGNKILPITDYLFGSSEWSNYPESGDTWNTMFNTSLAQGNYGATLSVAQGWTADGNGPSWRVGPAGGGDVWNGFSSYDPRYSMLDFSFSEGFEETGVPTASAYTTTGFKWSSDGTVDWDATPALVGSQSLKVTGAGYAALKTNTIYGKVKFSFRAKATTRSGATDLLVFVDDADEVVSKLKINASNKLEAHHCSGGTCTGDQLKTGSATIADNTEYYYWVEWETTTVTTAYNQGSLRVYVSATSTKPSAADVAVYSSSTQAGGSGDGRLQYIRFAASADNVIVFDAVADDVSDLKEYVAGLKNTTSYPKNLGWLFDDEPDMGAEANYNSLYAAWKDTIHGLDTDHPVWVTAYGRDYDVDSATYAATSYDRGRNWGLYLTNNVFHGARTILADVFTYDHYFHHYSWHTWSGSTIGDKSGWYPNFEKFVESVDWTINQMHNLIPVGVIHEPLDLADSLCFNSTTYFNYACATNAKTMNVPIGSIAGTWTASTKAAPKYVRFGGNNSKVAELLDVRINDGATDARLITQYPTTHPSYNSHIVIHELNSTFDADTLANGDAVAECTALDNTTYGSVTCASVSEANTAQVITGDTSKVPYLGGTEYKRRPGGSANANIMWTPMPTPQGYKSAVWLSLIHGCRVVGNFPRHTQSSLLHKTTLAEIKTTLEGAVGQALLGPVATSLFTVPAANKGGWASATVATNGKVDYTVRDYSATDGKVYVIAGRVKKHSGDDAGDTTAQMPVTGLAAGTTVAVIGESRNVTAGDGYIQDDFNPHAVHIYSIQDNPAPPDATAPTITSVTSTTANGRYGVGDTINVTVNFSEAVSSTGNVTVTCETGATDATCTFAPSLEISKSCTITLVKGYASADLDCTVSGTIKDADTNAMSNYTPTTGLAAGKALVISTEDYNQRKRSGARCAGCR